MRRRDSTAIPPRARGHEAEWNRRRRHGDYAGRISTFIRGRAGRMDTGEVLHSAVDRGLNRKSLARASGSVVLLRQTLIAYWTQ